MADARELLIKLTVDAAQADRRLKDIANSTSKLEKSLGAAGGALRGFVGGLAGAVSIGAMVTAFKSAANAMDEMAKASQKIGVSVESLSALNYAASQSGVSFEGLQTGLKKLNQSLIDVEKGTSEAAKALRALGVKGADSPEEALSKIADAFASVPDSAQKTAIAMAIFGKSGADLIPMLNAGADGLKKFEDRAKQLGIVIDTETAKQAEKFNDSLDDMQLAMGAIVKNIAAGMMPAFSALSEKMAESAKVGGEWKQFGTDIVNTIVLIGKFADQVLLPVRAITGALGHLIAAGALLSQGEFRNFVSLLKGMGTNGEIAARGVQGLRDPLNSVLDAQDQVNNIEKEAIELGKKFIAQQKEKEAAAKRWAAAQNALKTSDAEKKRAEALRAQADAAKAYASSLDQIRAIEDEAKGFGEKFLRSEGEKSNALQAQVDALEDMANPMREYTRGQEQLYALWETGKLSAEGLAAGMAVLDDKLQSSSTIAKDAPKQLDDMQKAMKNLAAQGIGGLVDAIFSADRSFKEFAGNFLQQIAKMIIQQQIFNALKGTTLGGWLGFAKGGAFGGATGLPHGVYNQPTFFNMPGNGPLQKFARGGVLGEAGPEAILPLRRGAGGKLGVDAAPVNVNVINNAGVNVGVEKDGNDINITIERVRNALTRDIRAGGNAFAGALQNTYGLNRANA